MSFRKPYTYISSSSTNKFNEEITKHGAYYILVRTNHRIRCPNIDPLSSLCSPNCPICMGLGFIFQYETHIMRKSLNRRSSISTGAEFIPYTFFIRSDANVKETDKILEVSWIAGTISRVLAEYEIIDVNTFLYDKNEAYQIASCVKISVSTENQNLKFLQSIINLGIKND